MMERMTEQAPGALWVWRHPRARGAESCCIGRSDVAVDPRRVRRLAYRIRRTAQRHGLPRHVLTSPSRRCADVGRWLRRWGWRHERLACLLEMDFGDWDGLRWADIPRESIDAWCKDFLRHRPGGAESLLELFARTAAWQAAAGSVVVGHAGWMLARRWLGTPRPLPSSAAQWPAPPRHGELWRLPAGALRLPRGDSAECGDGT